MYCIKETSFSQIEYYTRQIIIIRYINLFYNHVQETGEYKTKTGTRIVKTLYTHTTPMTKYVDKLIQYSDL